MPITPASGIKAAPEAAVALIRVSGPRPEYLLLRRAQNPKDPWSGHFALPGGRREVGDNGLLETCIRETREECGLTLYSEQLVEALPHFGAGRNAGRPTVVAPFLFEIPFRPALSLDLMEIASYHWVGEEYLLRPANHGRAKLSPGHPEILFPCIWLDSGAIWGFTYHVLRGHFGGSAPFPGEAESAPGVTASGEGVRVQAEYSR